MMIMTLSGSAPYERARGSSNPRAKLNPVFNTFVTDQLSYTLEEESSSPESTMIVISGFFSWSFLSGPCARISAFSSSVNDIGYENPSSISPLFEISGACGSGGGLEYVYSYVPA